MENFRFESQSETVPFALANPIPHCPVVLVLDTSHSMWGQGLTDLKNALHTFFASLSTGNFGGAQIDIAAVSMGSNLGLLSPFTEFDQSPISGMDIRPKGDTPIGAALALALETIDRKIEQYHAIGQSCITPQLIVLTDGESSDDFSASVSEIRRRCSTGTLVCRAVALGSTPNLAVLAEIAGDNVMAPCRGGLAETFSDVGKIVSQSYEEEAAEVIEAAAAEPVTPAPAASGTIYLLDGSNILCWEEPRYGITLNKVLAMTDHFDRNGIAYQVFFDATAPHWLKTLPGEEYTRYQELLTQRADLFRQVPAQTSADDFLLAAADRNPTAVILSNDCFRDHRQEYPWLGSGNRVAHGMFLSNMIFFPKISLKIPWNASENVSNTTL